MAASSGGLNQEIEFCIVEMERLKVAELKSVSRSIGLSLGGRKADLQDRLRAYLKNSLRVGSIDPWRPKTILHLIEKARLNEPMPTYEHVWQTLKDGIHRHPVATGHQSPSTLAQPSSLQVPKPAPVNQSPKTRLALQFGESPFYKLRRMVNGSPKLAAKNNGRGVCNYKFSLNQDELSILQRGPQFKLYLFSGVLDPLEPRGDVPIQFPHPNEIRFNDIQVKDNVRGLKNKLGTAKPANLTPYLKPVGSDNLLQLIYAFTKDDYLIYCYLVEVIPPERILEEVLRHPKIVKPATLQYLKESLSEDEDEDLVTTSTVMTLQCPISYCRMRYPSKSVHCQHLQCFDALWFIESQQQIPTWHCPVCQKKIKIEDLAVCEFVEDIINQCDDEIEQVEISRDGSWKPIFEDDTPAPQPQSTTAVKLENGQSLNALEAESDDSEDIPLRSRQRNKQQHEPIVISLDSEDESMSPPEQTTSAPEAPTQTPNNLDENNTSALQRHGTLGSIYGTYMDSNQNPEPRRSLDPRNLDTTPSVGRFHHVGEISQQAESPNSSPYVQHNNHIPNLLGKTPLNNNVTDVRNNDQNSVQKSPSPTSASQQSSVRVSHDFNEMNIPLLNGSRQSTNAEREQLPRLQQNEITSASKPADTAGYRPSSFANNSLPPPIQETARQENLLGLGGDTNQIVIRQNGHTLDPMQGSSNPVNNENSTVAHNQQNGPALRSPNHSQSSSIPAPDSALDRNGNEEVVVAPTVQSLPGNTVAIPRTQGPPPPLPSLPPMPHAINRNVDQNARLRKPIVSPFIPKKPYVNMLPQKRQISSSSINKVAPTNVNGHSSRPGVVQSSEGVSVTSSSEPPPLASSATDDLDFIDLTSDE